MKNTDLTPSSAKFRNTWVLRSGGLGDFLLTLPLLKALRQRAERLTVVTRRSYAALAGEDLPETDWIDMDGPGASSLFGQPGPEIRDRLGGARVFSFLGEGDRHLAQNLRDCGCEDVVFLKSRPDQPPHVAAQMFGAAGMEAPPDLYGRAWLIRPPRRGRELWVHPGSGSSEKNASLDTFRSRISLTMKDAAFDGVRVILGEAERHRHAEVRRAFGDWRPDFMVEPGLSELRKGMASSALRFIGNDSGVSHLAAMLGIPVDVFFVSTNPEIWRPLGPKVTLLEVPARFS